MNVLSVWFSPNNAQIKFGTVGSHGSKAYPRSAPRTHRNTVCNIFSRMRAVKNRTPQSKLTFMNIISICFLPYNPQIKFETVGSPRSNQHPQDFSSVCCSSLHHRLPIFTTGYNLSNKEQSPNRSHWPVKPSCHLATPHITDCSP